jgi:putative DNA primase/helicase
MKSHSARQTALLGASELKRQIPDLSSVARDFYGIDFRDSVAKCPFWQNHAHGDSDPSLRYDRRKKRLFCASQNCFGEKGADAIGLVQIMDRCEFSTALQKLASHYGIRANGKGPSSGLAPCSKPVRPQREMSTERENILAENVRSQLERRGFLKTAEYWYGPHLRKVRFEHEVKKQSKKARPEKTFRWEHVVDGVWYSGDGDIPKPLYINSVLRQGHQIGLAIGFEGEGKADCAGNLAIAGFSFKNITPEQAAQLAGCDIVLWPDNDSSGFRQARAAYRVISDAARVRSIRLLQPAAEVPASGDIIDVVNDLKWDRTAIVQFLESSRPYVALGEEDAQGLPARAEADVSEITADSGGNRANYSSRSFSVSDAEVFFLRESDSNIRPVRIAARVNVVAETRDVNGVNWGRLLTWRDNEGALHRCAMPMDLLASDAREVRAHLLAEGLPYISTNRGDRERFTEYLQTAHVTRRALCVSRIGWHGKTYVLPDQTFVAGDAEEILYQASHGATHHWGINGTANQWRERVGRFCRGNTRLVLAAACGFAGPLLSLAGAESGGIHLHGPTSTGKSTALVVGASVCGGGRTGFVQTWRTTVNGLESVAEAHNDATLFLDELAQVDAREAADTLYMLANGQGKARMTRDGEPRKKLTWTLLCVSAGEVTLAEHASSVGKRTKGGVEVRLLNIRADAGHGLGIFETLHEISSPESFVHELREGARECYGAPFRAFLVRLTGDLAAAKSMISSARASIGRVVPPDALGEVRRAADRLAVIGAAGELATGWGLTGWRESESIEAAQLCFLDWLSTRGTKGNSDLQAAIGQVCAFLERHGASRFELIRTACGNRHDPQEEAHPVSERAGFRRCAPRGGEIEYLVFREVFRGEMCAGYDHQAVLTELDRRGFLVRAPASMTIKPRLPGLGTLRVYCIRGTILQADEC